MRHTRRVSPISTTQQGFITEGEWMKLLTPGSDGELECMAPKTDDEPARSEDAYPRSVTPGFIFQSKSTAYLDRRYRARRLSIHFPVAKSRLVSHPLFWYLFAYLDIEAMGFANPVSWCLHSRSIRMPIRSYEVIRGPLTSIRAWRQMPTIIGASFKSAQEALAAAYSNCFAPNRPRQRPFSSPARVAGGLDLG